MSRAQGWLDALAFSAAPVAASAGALTAAAALAIGHRVGVLEPALAAAGSLVVYTVDRLRDRERDASTSPDRTRFVTRHAGPLMAVAGLAAAAAAAITLALGPRVALVLAPIAALGLLHRRLKGLPYLKGPYVAAAWVAVVVGIPWSVAEEPRHVVWTCAVLFGALLANVLGSNVRDNEAAAASLGGTRVLGWARGLALLASVAALLAPAEVRPLAAVPAATWLALLRFRADERYGLLVLDGALPIGALLACAVSLSR